jgi:hypothetical protein
MSTIISSPTIEIPDPFRHASFTRCAECGQWKTLILGQYLDTDGEVHKCRKETNVRRKRDK